MAKTPKISVIIPVYNVEKYLYRCVDSVLLQTYKNLEIFLVDDGSPDNCGKICDEYADKDSRIKVIHKENGGLSDARNTAMKVMTGEYVTFVDSDDWVSPYYVENLYLAIEQSGADMSVSWYEDVWTDDKFNIHKPKQGCIGLLTLTSEDCLERMLYQNKVETMACAKLYKIELITGITFPVGKLYEDLATTYKIIDRSNKIALISNIDYYYFQRDESIQNCEFDIRKMDAIVHMKKIIKFVETNYPSIKKAAYCRCVSAAFNLIFQINDDRYKEQKYELWNIIRKYRKIVLLDRNARNKARIAALMSYFGFKCVKTLYSITQKRAK